jgi:hypothetical protein
MPIALPAAPEVTSIAVGTEKGNPTLFLCYTVPNSPGVHERRIRINAVDMAKLAELKFRIRNV